MNSNAVGETSKDLGITKQMTTSDPGPRTVERRYSRKNVSIRALLHSNGKFQTTTIEDLSQGGAQLRGAEGISIGDVVLVELLDRRQLHGEVRWWLANRCGLSFSDNLSESDPLFSR